MSLVRLGPALGKGGEGAVHSVQGAPNLVAKIYRKPPNALKVEKLAAMTGMSSDPLQRVAAWPVDLLLDENQVARGFLMPKVSAREDVHELYSPKSRRQAFPNVDFRFVVRASANIARAFALMHEQGHVIADVNHGNALIGHDGTVVLIDCDSFQIRDRIRTYPCDVGVPLFTAPELQGRAFRGLRRTANHDAFGLAVLLFHLLFVGRHPFAGRHESGEMPIERAIAESRFVYGAASASLGMSAPPGTLPLGAFGTRIANLFERAFAAPGNAERPAATQWINALEDLERVLAPCEVSRLHYHHREYYCCWCDIEGRTGVQLFAAQLPAAEAFNTAALKSLWDEITAVPRPMPELPVPRARVSNASRASRSLLSRFLVFFGMTRSPLKFALAEERWKDLAQEWQHECSIVPFERELTQLVEAKEQLLDLPKMREVQLDALEKRKEWQQRSRYLEGFSIDGAAFQHIGPSEVQKLRRAGIETAADIGRHPTTLNDMLDWTAALELRTWYRLRDEAFKFDPSEPADPRDLAHIDEIVRNRQEELVTRLQEGPALLRGKLDELTAARNRLQPRIDEAWHALEQARSSSEW